MDNKQILNQVTQQASFKDVVMTNDLGASILQPAYRNQFIREATRDKTILAEARRVLMNSHVENIDRIGFSGRVMEKAVENTDPKGSKPTPKQEQLIADEYIAMVGITDKAYRRSIERKNFTNTLVTMLAEKYGEDWETFAVAADKTKFEEDSLLQESNGWISKCNKKMYGKGTGKSFDGTKIIDMLKSMIKQYPKNYLKNRSSLRFYLDSDYFDMYIDEVGERPTVAGDEAVSKNIARPYKGIPVKEATCLNDEEILSGDGWGPVAMLQHPDNMVYGIFEDITLEPERSAKKRRTDYVLTNEVDQGYENPDIGVVAFPDTTKPVTP